MLTVGIVKALIKDMSDDSEVLCSDKDMVGPHWLNPRSVESGIVGGKEVLIISLPFNDIEDMKNAQIIRGGIEHG